MYQVVLVDDEPYIIDNLMTAIEWSGYNLEISYTTTSPHQALEYLKNHTVHLLITDISMPQMNGIDLIRAAKLINPLLNTIILSAHNNFEYVRSAMQCGAENYLLKPLDPNDLRETISQLANHILEREELSKSYGPSTLTFRSHFAEQWVKNLISPNELVTRAKLLDMDLSADNYTVIIFSTTSNDTLKMSKFFEMILTAFISHFITTIYFETPKRFVCILTKINKLESNLQDITKLSNNISSLLGLSVFVSIGITVTAYTSVPESYLSAHCMLFLKFTRLESFVYTESILSVKQYIDTSLSIYSSFDKIDSEVLENIANKLFKKSNNTNTSLIICLFILSDSFKKLTKDTSEISSKYPSLYKFLETLPNTTNSQKEIVTYTLTFLKQCKIITSQDPNYYPFVEAAIKAIHEFSDKDISLKTLANKLNMSPSYLGNMFKRQTGYYFNDYLAEARLKYAAELIETTDMKIKDIVDCVGFSSQTYFNHTFKRYFNISPMSYRRNKKIANL